MTRQYLRYAGPSKEVGKQQNKLEFKCMRNGNIQRTLVIYPEKDKVIVEEYEQTVDQKTGESYMRLVHCNVHNKFSYAKSEWVGRICSAAYEMGNNEPDSSLFNSILGGR